VGDGVLLSIRSPVLTEIKNKVSDDVEAARHREPFGVAFVTNQKLTNGEKKTLKSLGGDIAVEVYHLETVTHILDHDLLHIREQYLFIPSTAPASTIPDVDLPRLDVTPEVIGVALRFVGSDELMAVLIEIHDKHEREWEEKVRERDARERRRRSGPLGAFTYDFNADVIASVMPHLIGSQEQEPAKPRTNDQLSADLARFAEELEGRWDRCTDYLASVAWPALHFRITNALKALPKNVEVVLTFHRAVGVEHVEGNTFEWEKLQDPDWKPPLPPNMAYAVAPPFSPSHLAGYPVQWRNVGDDLVVTITVPEVRPHSPQLLEGDDIVLLVRSSDADAVAVTWTASAEASGVYVECEGEFAMPIEDVEAREATYQALHASD